MSETVPSPPEDGNGVIAVEDNPAAKEKSTGEQRRRRRPKPGENTSKDSHGSGDGGAYIPSNSAPRSRKPRGERTRRTHNKDRSSANEEPGSMDESQPIEHLNESVGDDSGVLNRSLDESGLSVSGSGQGPDREQRRRRRPKRTGSNDSGEHGDTTTATTERRSSGKDPSSRRRGVERNKSAPREPRRKPERTRSSLSNSDGSTGRRLPDRSRSSSSAEKPPPTTRTRSPTRTKGMDASAPQLGRRGTRTIRNGTAMTDASERMAAERRRRRMADNSEPATSSPMVDASETARRRTRRGMGDSSSRGGGSGAALRRHRTADGIVHHHRRRGGAEDNNNDEAPALVPSIAEGEEGSLTASPRKLQPALRRMRTEEVRNSPVRSMGRAADRRSSRRPASNAALALVNAVDVRNSTLDHAGQPFPYIGTGSNNLDDDDSASEDEEGMVGDGSGNSLNDSKASMMDESKKSSSKSRRIKKLLPIGKLFKSSSKGGEKSKEAAEEGLDESESTDVYDLDD